MSKSTVAVKSTELPTVDSLTEGFEECANVSIKEFKGAFKSSCTGSKKLSQSVKSMIAGVDKQSDPKAIRAAAEEVARYTQMAVNTATLELLTAPVVDALKTAAKDRLAGQEIKVEKYAQDKRTIIQAAGYISTICKSELGFSIRSATRPKPWVDGSLHEYKAEAVANRVKAENELDAEESGEEIQDKVTATLETRFANLIGTYGLEEVAKHCAELVNAKGGFAESFVKELAELSK